MYSCTTLRPALAVARVNAVSIVARLARLFLVRVGFTTARAVRAGTRRALAVVLYALDAHAVLACNALHTCALHLECA